MVRFLRRWARRQARHPTILLAVVASLTLGIAAITCVLGVFRQTLLDPLPGLYTPGLVALKHGEFREDGDEYKIRDLATIRQLTGVFDDVAAYCRLRPEQPAQLNGVSTPVVTLMVTETYFDVLGVTMAAGRSFDSADATPSASSAVISYTLAQSAFGSPGEALGNRLRIGSLDATIVGVTALKFFGTDLAVRPDIYLPAAVMPHVNPLRFDWFGERAPMWVKFVGRLKAGVSISAANETLSTLDTLPVGQQLGWGVSARVVDVRRAVIPSRLWASYTTVLQLFAVVSVGILLSASVSAATLFLVQSEQRQREEAICLSLGISRGRLLIEKSIEAIAPALVAISLVFPLSSLLLAGLTFFLGRYRYDIVGPFTPGSAELLLAGGTAGILSWITAFVVARGTSAIDCARALGKGSGSTATTNRLYRKILTSGHVAVATVLLCINVLLIRSIEAIHSTDLGYEPDGVIEASIDFSSAWTTETQRRARLEQIFQELRSRLAGTPVAITGPYRASSWRAITGSSVESPARSRRSFHVFAVTGGYFEVLGIKPVDGRLFDDVDDQSAVINVKARRLLSVDGGVIGQRLGPGAARTEVIGVVPDLRQSAKEDTYPTIYIPMNALPRLYKDVDIPEMATLGVPKQVTIVARTNQARLVADVIERTIRSDPSTSLHVQSTSERIRSDAALQESTLAALGLLALSAVFLTGLSIYVLITSTIVSRARECGIRTALGSPRRAIGWLIGKETLTAVAVGIVTGGLLVSSAGSMLRHLLFGVQPTDPLTFALTSFAMLLVAAGFVYRPIASQLRTNAVELLREP